MHDDTRDNAEGSPEGPRRAGNGLLRRAFAEPRGRAGAWALLVAVALFASGPETGVLAPWIRRFEEMGGDRLVHGLLFFVQAWLLVGAFERGGEEGREANRAAGRGAGVGAGVAAAVVAAAYGGASEVVQAYLPGRSAELADFAADAVGAVAGAVAAAMRSGRKRLRL